MVLPPRDSWLPARAMKFAGKPRNARHRAGHGATTAPKRENRHPAGEGAGPQPVPGDYDLVRSNHEREGGIFRVNTRTGEVSVCYVQTDKVVCTPQAR